MGGVYVLEGGEKRKPDGASLLLTTGERGGRSVSGPGVRKGVREERRVREVEWVFELNLSKEWGIDLDLR